MRGIHINEACDLTAIEARVQADIGTAERKPDYYEGTILTGGS